MDEAISRQAAIDEGMSYINGDCFCDKEDFAKYIEFIEQLPPIQSEIVRCKDCKHYDEIVHCDRVSWWNGKDDYCSRAESREERGDNMNIDLEKDIVQSLSSLYSLQEFEEKAIDIVLNAIPHWIPVTERLPEESGLYQVTDMQGNVVRYVFNVSEGSEEYWRRCVKAWMPLPEPYKGVTE